MSEVLKNSSGEKVDAENRLAVLEEAAGKFDPEAAIQRRLDSMNDKALDGELKEISKKQKQHFEEDIFAAKAAVRQSYENNWVEKNDFGLELEKFGKKQADKENHERYGENITSEAAKRCFSKEFVALKSKFEKVKRAEAKEKEMSFRDSQKSYEKRLKDGIVMSAEDRKHLVEMESMDIYQREEYGREKRQAYMEIQKKKDKHPIKFRQLTRKKHLSIPKEWDSADYSLNDLKHISSELILLDDK